MPNHHPHKEGKMAKMMKEQTAKISSDVYLWAAAGCITLSLGLLIIGLYNELAKVAKHDEDEEGGGKSVLYDRATKQLSESF